MQNSSQGTMHGAVPPYMPGWPPLNPHDVYQQSFQGIKPFTSVTPPVPPLNLAGYQASHVERALPPSWSNGFSLPPGMDPLGNTFNGAKGYLNYKSQNPSPVPQHLTQHNSGQQRSPNLHGTDQLSTKYRSNVPLEAHNRVDTNKEVHNHIQDKLVNGYSNTRVDSDSQHLDLHLPSKLRNHSDLPHRKGPDSYPNGSHSQIKELATNSSGFHRNSSLLSSSAATSETSSRFDGTVISKPKDGHYPAHIASLTAMPYFGAAGHLPPTSTTGQSITAPPFSNSMVSQAHPRDTPRDYQTHTGKDLSVASSTSNQRANKIAAEIFAEAQSSMMKTSDGNKLPSFSNISNIVMNDKRQHGYDPYDFPSDERIPVDSRSENNIGNAQHGPNGLLPLNYWSNFGAVAPNVSLDKRDNLIHRETSTSANEQINTVEYKLNDNKGEDGVRHAMSIKEMVEKKRNEKQNKKRTNNSAVDPNINQLVDAKVQEILAAYKERELQKSMNPVKPKSSKSTPAFVSNTSQYKQLDVSNDQNPGSAHHINNHEGNQSLREERNSVTPRSDHSSGTDVYDNGRKESSIKGLYQPGTNEGLHNQSVYPPSSRHSQYQPDVQIEYRPSSRDMLNQPGTQAFYRPSSRDMQHHSDNRDLNCPSSINIQHHPDSQGVNRPSSRDLQHHPDTQGAFRPSSRDQPGSQGVYRPNSRDSIHQPDTQGAFRPNSRDQPSSQGVYRPNSRDSIHQPDIQGMYRPSSRDLQHQPGSQGIYGPNSRDMHHQPDTKGVYRPSSRELQQQIMDMRLHRKETLEKSAQEMAHPGSGPDGYTHKFDLPNHSPQNEHSLALYKQVNEMRSHKKQVYDAPPKHGLDHRLQPPPYPSSHPYYQQDQHYRVSLQQQVHDMRNLKKDSSHGFSENMAMNQNEHHGRKTPYYENYKELGGQFSEKFVNHKFHQEPRINGNFINSGLNLSTKKDPYDFDGLSDKLSFEHPNMHLSEFHKRNGFTSNYGYLPEHHRSRMKLDTDRKYIHRSYDPSFVDKAAQGLGYNKKIGSKPYGYKSSLSLLKKSHKYNGKLSLPIKKVGKLGRPLGRPPGKLSGKLKSKVTKDLFADNLLKNLGFPPLTKNDLNLYTVPKLKFNFINGHCVKNPFASGEKTVGQEIITGSKTPAESVVKLESVGFKTDNIGLKTENIGFKSENEVGEIKHSSVDITNTIKRNRCTLQRSRSFDSGLAQPMEYNTIQRSRSFDDCRKLFKSNTDVTKKDLCDKTDEDGRMGVAESEVENLTNQIKDLKRMVTGQLEDYKHQLETNTVVSVPKCGCLGPDHIFNESVEGPYYTHLGAGRSVEAVRQILEKRTGMEGKAIRIEKVRYTGKEGKSSQGCPIAKWIIRRSSMDEKYLALLRHRPGHSCDTAWLIIGLVAWEGVPTNQADELYSYLSNTLPQNGFETERRCGTNDRKTCACQGIDMKSRGASFSFGCSWSMYFNGCKFARSQVARKFRLKNMDQEPLLEDRMQKLATQIAPLYKQCAPQAHFNQSYYSDKGSHCRLGTDKPGPFSGVTACADFCAHAHKDIHNMNNGSTVVVTLTKHRGLSKPDDEQLHVLPLYVLEPTDEKGSYDAQYDKIQSGALEVLHHYAMEARLRSQPLESCRKRRMNKMNKSPGKKGRSPSRGRTSPWNGSTSSNQSTPKKFKQIKDMSYLHSQDSSQSLSSQAASMGGTPIKQHTHPNDVTPIKHNSHHSLSDESQRFNGIISGNPTSYNAQDGNHISNGGHNEHPISNIGVNHGLPLPKDAHDGNSTSTNVFHHGMPFPKDARNVNPTSTSFHNGMPLPKDAQGGNPTSTGFHHGMPLPKDAQGGNPTSTGFHHGMPLPKDAQGGNPTSTGFNHGMPLPKNPHGDNTTSTNVFHHGMPLPKDAQGGNPTSTGFNHGMPLPKNLHGENTTSTNVFHHGMPLPKDAQGGNPTSTGFHHGMPLPKDAQGENPTSTGFHHGMPLPKDAQGGNPTSTGFNHGMPLPKNPHGDNTTSTNVFHHGMPLPKDAQGGNPTSTGFNHGMPLPKDAQGGNPTSTGFNHGMPLPKDAQGGNPTSTGFNHGMPLPKNPHGDYTTSTNVFHHGMPLPKDAHHGNPTSTGFNHGIPLPKDAHADNPTSTNVFHHGMSLPKDAQGGNPTSTGFQHGMPLPKNAHGDNATSTNVFHHGMPLPKDAQGGNPISTGFNHEMPLPKNTQAGNPMSSSGNHGISISKDAHGGNTASNSGHHGIPISNGIHDGSQISVGVQDSTLKSYGEQDRNSISNGVHKGNPISNVVRNGNQMLPKDASKVKQFHPGFEGLYDKFWNYFEANGSFPPPAFMAQYARARQMLLDSEEAKQSEIISQQTGDSSKAIEADNVNRPGGQTGFQPPDTNQGHVDGINLKQTDVGNMYQRQQTPPNNVNGPKDQLSHLTVNGADTHKSSDSPLEHDARARTGDAERSNNTTSHNSAVQNSENNFKTFQNSMPVGSNDGKDPMFVKPQISHSQEHVQSPTVPSQQQAAQTGNQSQGTSGHRRDYVTLTNPFNDGPVTREPGQPQDNASMFDNRVAKQPEGPQGSSFIRDNELIRHLAPSKKDMQEVTKTKQQIPHEGNNILHTDIDAKQPLQPQGHIPMLPSVEKNHSQMFNKGSNDIPQTSAMDLSSTTSNIKDLESGSHSSKPQLHEPSNQQHMLHLPSNQGHQIHNQANQKHLPFESSNQDHQIHNAANQRHLPFESSNQDHLLHKPSNQVVNMAPNQQGQWSHQGHSLSGQSHLSLLSDTVHARTKDLGTKEVTAPLGFMRDNVNQNKSVNDNSHETKTDHLRAHAHPVDSNIHRNNYVEKDQSATDTVHQNDANRAKPSHYSDGTTGPFVGKTPLYTPYQMDQKGDSQNSSRNTSGQNNANIHPVNLTNSSGAYHDSGRSEYHNFHANEQKSSQISWNMFNYNAQKLPSHNNSSAMLNGQLPIKEETDENTLDPDIVKCEMEYNEDAFRDPNIGGVAVALCHGAVLFEVAKRELHATTGLKNPNRYRPTRISLVFYQHKNLNTERHGMYAYAKKLEKMKLERIAKMQEQQGFVDMAEIENSFKSGKKRKMEDIKEKPFNDNEEYDIMKTSAIHYRYMLECDAKRQESQTTNSFLTNWVKPQPMVTGPFQKWV